MKIEVRQATQKDSLLCFAITEEAMRGYVEATWGAWEPESQRRLHAESFSPASHWIVLADGEIAGVVAATLEPSHVQLVKLYLRTQARNHGLGGRILSSVLKAAANRSLPLRLRVLTVNTRAQAFYKRYGFRESSRTAERVFMEARPDPFIERMSSGKLRLAAAAAHFKR